jgi:MSHA biogenesis protein MshK
MAQGLTVRGALLLLALGVSSAGQAALAQPLADPTRPPNVSPMEPALGASPESTTRLQSVLISPTRKLAVIDGQTVRLGGRVGDATLVDISETQVVLQRHGESQTLKLHPAAEKKPVVRGVSPEARQ